MTITQTHFAGLYALSLISNLQSGESSWCCWRGMYTTAQFPALMSIWSGEGMHVRPWESQLRLLSIYWLHFDHSSCMSSRYYLCTVLVIATPQLGAAGGRMTATARRDCPQPTGEAAARHGLAPVAGSSCALASIFLVVTLIYAIETAKFVASWIDYRDAIARRR